MLPPTSAHETERLAALARYDIMDTAREREFDDIVTIAAQICGTPMALISLVDETRQWFKAAVGLSAPQTPRGIAFCAHAIEQSGTFIVEDASQDARFDQNPLVTADPHLRFYAGAPLQTSDGYALGTLCVLDSSPRKLSEAQERALRALSRQVIALLELRRLNFAQRLEQEQRATLLEAQIQTERATGELREQFIAILGHDLRNPLQAIHAGGELIERKSGDKSIAGVANRIKTNARRMSALIDDILDFARGRLGSGIGLQLKAIDDVKTALIDVIEELRAAAPQRQVIYDIDVSSPVICDIGRIQQVVSNLVGNALTHGALDKAVEVSAKNTLDELLIEVWNDGDPIPLDSIHKIFEPFWRQSTSSERQGLGLGLHIASQIVRAHHGSLTVQSRREHGTRFTVRLPLRQAV